MSEAEQCSRCEPAYKKPLVDFVIAAYVAQTQVCLTCQAKSTKIEEDEKLANILKLAVDITRGFAALHPNGNVTYAELAEYFYDTVRDLPGFSG